MSGRKKGEKSGSGIHINPKHKGELHRDLGVPAGQPIPAAKLAKAKQSSDPAVRKRATFAENAKHFKHGGKKSSPIHQAMTKRST